MAERAYPAAVLIYMLLSSGIGVTVGLTGRNRLFELGHRWMSTTFARQWPYINYPVCMINNIQFMFNNKK